MNQEKIFSKQWCMAYLYIIIGSLIFAIGDVMFANPYILAPGGVYGLANVLNHVHPWEISNYSLCMDIPLLLIGTLILGPKFGVKTVVSIILIWAFVKGIENFWGYAPIIHNGIVDNPEEIPEFFKNSLIAFPDKAGKTVYFIPDYFLNTVVAGVIYGVAIGLIFKSGSAAVSPATFEMPATDVVITATFENNAELTSIADASVAVPQQDYIYKNSAYPPEPTVTLNSVTLGKGQDYTVEYSDNVNAGTADIGNYNISDMNGRGKGDGLKLLKAVKYLSLGNV